MLLNLHKDKIGILLGWTAYLYYKEKPPHCGGEVIGYEYCLWEWGCSLNFL